MDAKMAALAAMGNQKLNHLDIIAHNLANVGTPGFKAVRFYLREMEANKGGAVPSIFTDFRAGLVEKTENSLDLAIEGDGFFTIETKRGIRYTRAGNFTIDRNSRLVTMKGDPVLGEAGPLILKGRKISVSAEGVVKVDGVEVGKLRIVDFENRQALSREGDGLFVDGGTAGVKQVGNPRLKAGERELSNVEAIREMVELIEVQRSFETYQKVIQSLADMDKLSTGRVGKLV